MEVSQVRERSKGEVHSEVEVKPYAQDVLDFHNLLKKYQVGGLSDLDVHAQFQKLLQETLVLKKEIASFTNMPVSFLQINSLSKNSSATILS